MLSSVHSLEGVPAYTKTLQMLVSLFTHSKMLIALFQLIVHIALSISVNACNRWWFGIHGINGVFLPS